MKITDKNGVRDLRKGVQSTPAKKEGAGLFSLFSSELQTKQQEVNNYNQDITELRASLDKVGQALEQEPTILNFKKFRELLSKLAKQVSSEAYRLEKVGGTPMNPRYYEIITVIDKEADKLYELVVKEQKDRMAITASVIGIKGLVVDLLT
ncbi:MAG: YaaR family protein [Geobacter sp.]|nr:YaaR family protein [Geobacter sp.]